MNANHFCRLGAGQQSRIHCTRLAGDKADNWWLRFNPRVLGIKWKKGTKRPDKSNAIDLLVSGELPKDGPEREGYESFFEEVPAEFTDQERVSNFDSNKVPENTEHFEECTLTHVS